MLEQTKVPVCLLDRLQLSSWLNAKDLIWVKLLQWLYLADLLCGKVPHEPQAESESYLEVETWPHPSFRVDLLPLFDHL